jgi:hypothetical protein
MVASSHEPDGRGSRRANLIGHHCMNLVIAQTIDAGLAG